MQNSNCECSKLKIGKIKACKICTKELMVKETFCAKELSSPKVCADLVVAREVDAQTACFKDLNSTNQCVQNVIATNAGVVNLTANNLCVSGTFSAASFVAVGKYRASSTYSSNVVYTLDTYINFDTILDDPNSNLTIAPTTYTVPISGYYIATLKYNSSLLTPIPAAVIVGAPQGRLQLWVNGVIAREEFSTYMSFFPEQKAILTSIMQLNAGDTVQMKYSVLYLDPVSGVTNVVGTVNSAGNGLDGDNSGFKIHILSANSGSTPIVCNPVIPCMACIPQVCIPCDPNDNGCDLDE